MAETTLPTQQGREVVGRALVVGTVQAYKRQVQDVLHPARAGLDDREEDYRRGFDSNFFETTSSTNGQPTSSRPVSRAK